MVNSITERQVEFIQTLVAERDPDACEPILEANRALWRRDRLDKQAASRAIEALKALPRAKDESTREPITTEVPEGKYALPAVDGSGDWVFYEVDKPTTGRWAGYTFVKRLQGAPGYWDATNVKRGTEQAVLDRISTAEYLDAFTFTDPDTGEIVVAPERLLTGPMAATVAFSRVHRTCARCGSPLSNRASLERGLGPVCVGYYE